MSRCRCRRRGAVLLVVLVVIVLLALGAYTFSETMISEREAVAMHGRKVASRVAADSGMQFVAAFVGERGSINESFLDNPQRLRNVFVSDSDFERGRSRFSVVAPRERDPTYQRIRFGVVEESSKLNLNAVIRRVVEDELAEDEARAILMRVPLLTRETADAILDWIDEDDLPRRYGAETEFYSRLPTPYQAKNGPLDTLDELLLVRGVTQEILFGEDANRNGLLDPNENDGDRSLPPDDADNVLSRGLFAMLTVHSRESNLRPDGRPKINVNQGSLQNLFKEISAEFGDDAAEFILAFRQQGADTSVGDASKNRDAPAKTRHINSLYELMGTEFRGEESGAAWKSPWSAEGNDLKKLLPELLNTLTTHGGPFIEGRININRARREVLLTVPEVDERLADLIIASQVGSSETVGGPRSITAWLLLDGHVDMAKMQQLDRYITARGDVYRAQVLGYFDAGETVTRIEAIIDATYRMPRIAALQDLTDLGAGHTRQQLAETESN